MIPFNSPYIPEVSRKYIQNALSSAHQQGDGPFSKIVANEVARIIGGGHVLLTTSCTHALEMASMLIHLGPGDEVILPSYTFTSAATAITKFGAKPIFVDIEEKTKCIDTTLIRSSITEKTKAISWVNYAGDTPNLEDLIKIAADYNLILIEDNAHSLGGTYQGRPLGSFGDFATQSFHATKNIQCGEGGALVINNENFIERAEIIREKGTDRSKFIRGEVQKYQWVDQGSSYLLAEPLAALLLGQLESFEEIQNSRRETFTRYSNLEILNQFEKINPISIEVAHMFYFLFKNDKQTEKFIFSMRKNGVNVARHYQPLHNSIFGRRYSNSVPEESLSEKVSQTLIRLPLWAKMSNFELDRVIDATNRSILEIH